MWCGFCDARVTAKFFGESGIFRCLECGKLINLKIEPAGTSTTSLSNTPEISGPTPLVTNEPISFHRVDTLSEQPNRRLSSTESPDRQDAAPVLTLLFITLIGFGFAMSQWALLSGHMAAWIAGIVFAISGIGFSLASMLTRSRITQRENALRNNVVVRRDKSTPKLWTHSPAREIKATSAHNSRGALNFNDQTVVSKPATLNATKASA